MHSRLSEGWLSACLEDTLSMDSHGRISVPDLEKSAWGKETAVPPPGCTGAVQAPRPSEAPPLRGCPASSSCLPRVPWDKLGNLSGAQGFSTDLRGSVRT